MRVAFLVNFIAPYRLVLLQELQTQFERMKVFVSTPMEPNRPWEVRWGKLDVEVQKNLTVRRAWRHPKGFTDTLYVQLPYNTVFSLNKYRPDIIVAHEFGMRTLQAALYCMLFPRTKLIVWAQISESTEQARGKARHLLRRFLTKRMDAVYVNGQSGRRYLQQNFSVPDNKFFYSPCTTNVESFAQLPLRRNAAASKRLLYIGQFIERKGIIPFLQVLNQWCARHPDQQHELWLAGGGPLQAQIDALQWPPNLTVVYKGMVPFEELPALYEQVGLMVFPTLADEWGLVTLEAMAAGVPVIGSIYAQSVEEMIEPGINGWTFKPDDAKDTYQAIDDALTTDTDRLNDMRASARAVALALTPEKVTQMMVKAIEFVR